MNGRIDMDNLMKQPFGSIKASGANAQGFNSFGSYDKVIGGMITTEQGAGTGGFAGGNGVSGLAIVTAYFQ